MRESEQGAWTGRHIFAFASICTQKLMKKREHYR